MKKKRSVQLKIVLLVPIAAGTILFSGTRCSADGGAAAVKDTPLDVCAKTLVHLDSMFAPLGRASCFCRLTDNLRSPQYVDFSLTFCTLLIPKIPTIFSGTGAPTGDRSELVSGDGPAAQPSEHTAGADTTIAPAP